MQWGDEGTESHGSWGMRFETNWEVHRPNGSMRRYRQTSSDAAREHWYKPSSSPTPSAARPAGDHCACARRALPFAWAGGSSVEVSAEVTAIDRGVGPCPFLRRPGAQGKRRSKTIRRRGCSARSVSRLELPRGNVGLGLPHPRSRRAPRSQRRRGPADPPGQPARVSELSGVMYVLDEPSHWPAPARQPADFIATLQRLRDHGQLGAGGRARRGDHPGRGSRGRLWARAPVVLGGEVVFMPAAPRSL